jgi:hypothetical protein
MIRFIFAVVTPVLMLAGCASGRSSAQQAAAPDLPFTVNGGLGSQYGNYPEAVTHDTLILQGRPCTVFNWDRPYAPGYVLRTRSASCPAESFSEGQLLSGDTAVELDRRIIPLAQSNLASRLP